MSGFQNEIDGLPAVLADPKAPDYIPELIVVGATDFRGENLWPKTNSDSDKRIPHVYAAGMGFYARKQTKELTPCIGRHTELRPVGRDIGHAPNA